MTNPNDVPELCECGHEKPDHIEYDAFDTVAGCEVERSLCTVRDRRNHLCECAAWTPRDAYWYADRAEDAAIARWEESVGR